MCCFCDVVCTCIFLFMSCVVFLWYCIYFYIPVNVLCGVVSSCLSISCLLFFVFLYILVHILFCVFEPCVYLYNPVHSFCGVFVVLCLLSVNFCAHMVFLTGLVFLQCCVYFCIAVHVLLGLFVVLCLPVYPLNGGCVTTWVRSTSSGYTIVGGGCPKDIVWIIIKFTGKC
jgi:hypothetical protein